MRELVMSAGGVVKVDFVYVGYWNGTFYCALSTTKSNGTQLPKGTWAGVEITNIYGWRDLNEMEPTE
jgi:hypothetical protein